MVGQADYRGAVDGLYLCGRHASRRRHRRRSANAAKVVIADMR